MKILKVLFTGILCAALLTGLCACRNPLEKRPPDSDQLFDPEVLDYFNISWLEKPENALNEEQHRDGSYYVYRANYATIEDFYSYTQLIFQSFLDKGYVTFFQTDVQSTGELWTLEYTCILQQSIDLEDFFVNNARNILYYRVYYTTSPNTQYNEEYDGYELQSISRISFVFDQQNPETGFFSCIMRLGNPYDRYICNSEI